MRGTSRTDKHSPYAMPGDFPIPRRVLRHNNRYVPVGLLPVAVPFDILGLVVCRARQSIPSEN